MSDKIIVTIDREFGSGGHEVGKRLAAKLGIRYFDEELISLAAAETGFNEEYIRINDEKAPDYSPATIFSGFDNYIQSPFARIQEEEFSIIRRIASEGSCVIVGRAADYILKDERHVSIFIFAPMEDRIQRLIAIAGDDPDKPHDVQGTEKHLRQMDKQRRKYYEFYTDNKWGSRDVYDLLINTSRAGIDGAVEIINAYIQAGKGLDLMSDL